MKADELFERAETHHEQVEPYLRPVADWFHDREGEMFTRDEAAEAISDDLDITEEDARNTIRALISDIVDPVVQVQDRPEKYVGVAEFHEYDGAYGFKDYHDTFGPRPSVVCAQCVHESTYDKEVAHAIAGEGTHDAGADYDELLDTVHEHYEQHHDGVKPEEVETGASLVSGTTIGGNTAFHAGNDGSGSGMNADFIDGKDSTAFNLTIQTDSGSDNLTNTSNNQQTINGSSNTGSTLYPYVIYIEASGTGGGSTNASASMDADVRFKDGSATQVASVSLNFPGDSGTNSRSGSSKGTVNDWNSAGGNPREPDYVDINYSITTGGGGTAEDSTADVTFSWDVRHLL